MTKKSIQFQRGFTLIELIVVMSIIAIIWGLVLASFLTVIKNSRDSRRIADVTQFSNTLEQFRSNNIDGIYPAVSTEPGFTWGTFDQINNASDNYMKNIPVEPNPSQTCSNYLYSVSVDHKTYTLFTELENTTSKEAAQTKPTPIASPAGNYYGNTFTVKNGPCKGTTFNYWINNP